MHGKSILSSSLAVTALLGNPCLTSIQAQQQTGKPVNFVIIHLDDMGYGDLGWQEPFLPLQHGFDEFFGIPYSHDMWPDHPVRKDYYPPLPLIEGNQTIATQPDISLFTTQFTERTVDFIRQQEEPFFVYLAHPLPHVPLAVSEKFKGKSTQGLYGDVMMEIDWSIGQIIDIIDKLEIAEHTLGIFTSDNGPWINYGNHAGSTGGLREGKGTSYEGGLYDLRRDPGERYDVSELYPEIVSKLERLANEARNGLGDDLTGNPGKNRREPGTVDVH